VNLHRLFYDAAQWWRREPVTAVIRELAASRTLSRDELRDLQWQRQRDLLRYAWETVPWYRQRMQEQGIEPREVSTREAWSTLPVVEKSEIQARSREFMSSRAPRGFAASTSGSSGTPVTIYRSQRSWAHAHANMIAHMGWHGVEWGERHAYFWGVPIDAAGRRKAQLRDAMFNRDRCSAFDLDDALAHRFYRRQIKRPARYAIGYPSALTRFAEALETLRLDGRALGWRVAITTAEVLHDHQRERIERVLGCGVADSYGSAEVGLIGLECEHARMHVPVESVAVDVVVNDEGLSELLLTDLHNYSQPLIRYRIGDVLREADDGSDAAPQAVDAAHAAAADPWATPPCPCGRPLPVIGRVSGRAGDTLELPDGRRINANLPSYIFKKHGKADTIREYQFVQFPGGRIVLRITLGPNWRDDTRPQLLTQVRDVLGIDVELEIVPRIERRGRGKHRDFVRAEGSEAR
jgi:phenylacetate-coenzyme A ligase PaaK-like adenylate-forming protein